MRIRDLGVVLLAIGVLLCPIAVHAAKQSIEPTGSLGAVDVLTRGGKLHLAQGMLTRIERREDLTQRERSLVSWEKARLKHKQGGGVEAALILEELLEDQGNEADTAALSNDLGVVQRQLGEIKQAQASFTRAQTIATRLGMTELAVRSSLNRLRTDLDLARPIDILARISEVEILIDQLSAGAAQTSAQFSLGQLVYRIQKDSPALGSLRRVAYDKLSNAASTALVLGEANTAALAIGHLGLLYEQEGKTNTALRLAVRALELGQAAPISSRAYLWEWLRARSLREKGDAVNALEAFKAAVEQLQALQSDLQIGSRNVYQDVIAPIFYQYTQVLLNRSEMLGDGEARQGALLRARDLLEQLKVVEVRDYFQSECLPLASNQLSIDTLDDLSGTAILYSMVLDDAVELLLYTGAGLENFSVATKRKDLSETVARFRKSVEVDDGSQAYREVGVDLYNLLIEPVGERLEALGVKTLVLVPDRMLRPIPFAALVNQRGDFLVKDLAVSTVAGMGMVNPRPLDMGGEFSIVTGGLSLALQYKGKEYPALDYVQNELDYLNTSFSVPGLRDKQFLTADVKKMLSQDYRIVHFATHGEFGRSYDDSFLLTFDGAVNMNDLADSIAARGEDAAPLELLVLSACKTAAGNDSELAALGLAGVSIRAGARSVLGALWTIKDSATAALIQDFYDELIKGSTKTEALRQAQLKLLESGRTHPSVWAPYLLIGNWR